jgi:hypothetical protein
MSFTNVLIIPMLLTFAGESTTGMVFSVAGLGLVVGSLVVSIWGGFKDRVASITFGIAAAGICLAFAGLRPNVVLVGAGFVLMLTILPLINTASQVLWQIKVPLDMQGRVFALRRTVAQMASPVAILAAGPLADRVFEPLLAPGGSLAGSVGTIIGTGPGRGIAFMVILSGLLTALLGVLGWLHPRVRHLQTELPDLIPDVPEDAPGGPEPTPAQV